MKYFILMVACFIGNTILAQDKKICEEIVGIAVDGVNNRSTDELKKHLAPDFTCVGQTGAVAMTVMEQLVTQLNEHISDIREISERQENGTLTLVYDFNYSKRLGHKNATFVFDTNNRLQQMDLLSVQIKKINPKADFEVSAQDIISVPMEIRNGLIVVTAKLNGVERKFILDSGAPTLYLNSRYFANDSIVSISTAKSVNSTISGQDVIRVKSFDFRGIRIHDTDFVMSDLSHLLENEEIYGLIGYRPIKDYDWLFDYANKTLMLIKPDKTADYIGKMHWTTYELPLKMVSETLHIPCVKGKIGAVEVHLGIDCGASTNLLDAALFDELKNYLTDIAVSELTGASKQKASVQKAVVPSLVFGEKSFELVATVFNDMSHLNAHMENKINGLIGYEILSRQKVLLSMESRKIIFIE